MISSRRRSSFTCASAGLLALSVAFVTSGCGAQPKPAADSPFPGLAAKDQAEVFQVLDQAEPMAASCRGSVACFSALARPFGPLNIVPGPKFGAADPKTANNILNFGLGDLGRAAGVDPKALANGFHCGPPCAETRKAQLSAALADTRQIAQAFSASGLTVVSLWPDGAVRADDVVYGGLYQLTRTPGLGIAVAKAGPAPAAAAPAKVAQIAAALRKTAATTVVRDEFGGVRLIHRDSIGDNEAGLLFATPEQFKRMDPRQLAGGRYVDIQPVAEGVYFYVRT